MQPRRDRGQRPRLEGDVCKLARDDGRRSVHPQVEARPGGAHRGPFQLARATSDRGYAKALPASNHTDSQCPNQVQSLLDCLG